MTSCSLSVCLALLGGIGRFPFAPGTVATVVAGIPFAWVMGLLPLPVGFLMLALVILVSCYVSDQTEKILKIHDPGAVVIDELAGYLVTMIGLPITVKSLLLGVVAFRLFDIWKPWPVSLCDQKVNGGLGIVLDDLAAGVFAHLSIWIILQLWS